jgi:hypothetical protein
MSPHGHFPRKLLALVALLLLVPSGTALGSQTYADSPGDAPGGAPDITSVAISHKLAGDVTFKVAFANRSTVAGDDLVIVGIDSDQNRGTGYSDGIDWEIYVPGDTPTLGWIYRWDAEDTSGVASVSWLNQAMTLTVNKAQVGNPTTAFNFGLISHTGGAMSLANVELFPHLGMPLLAYSLATEIARVQLPKAVSTVKAGKVFSIRGAKVELTTDEVFSPDTLTARRRSAAKR